MQKVSKLAIENWQTEQKVVLKLFIGFIMLSAAIMIMIKDLVPVTFFDTLEPLGIMTFFFGILWLVIWVMIALLGFWICKVNIGKIAHWFFED
jgi:hypothetical protein